MISLEIIFPYVTTIPRRCEGTSIFSNERPEKFTFHEQQPKSIWYIQDIDKPIEDKGR